MYGIHILWGNVTVETVEARKGLFLKRALELHIVTRHGLVYLLADSS